MFMCHLETNEQYQTLSRIRVTTILNILVKMYVERDVFEPFTWKKSGLRAEKPSYIFSQAKRHFALHCLLQRELTFTVCLHYTYSNMDDEVQERQPVTVGKPLVSKLNLHEPRPPRACSASSSSSSFSLDSFKITECSSFTEAFASVDSASNACSYYAQTGRESSTTDSPTSSRSANIPEETDSPELFDAPQSLVASKSLPHSQVSDTNYKFSDMYNLNSY